MICFITVFLISQNLYHHFHCAMFDSLLLLWSPAIRGQFFYNIFLLKEAMLSEQVQCLTSSYLSVALKRRTHNGWLVKHMQTEENEECCIKLMCTQDTAIHSSWITRQDVSRARSMRTNMSTSPHYMVKMEAYSSILWEIKLCWTFEAHLNVNQLNDMVQFMWEDKKMSLYYILTKSKNIHCRRIHKSMFTQCRKTGYMRLPKYIQWEYLKWNILSNTEDEFNVDWRNGSLDGHVFIVGLSCLQGFY